MDDVDFRIAEHGSDVGGPSADTEVRCATRRPGTICAHDDFYVRVSSAADSVHMMWTDESHADDSRTQSSHRRGIGRR
jgi:hypothetical protein